MVYWLSSFNSVFCHIRHSRIFGLKMRVRPFFCRLSEKNIENFQNFYCYLLKKVYDFRTCLGRFRLNFTQDF